MLKAVFGNSYVDGMEWIIRLTTVWCLVNSGNAFSLLFALIIFIIGFKRPIPETKPISSWNGQEFSKGW